MRTAERLFAERGIDAVSLREIGQVAGQRNNAATQYHFGTRSELLRAIYNFRAQSINARRLEIIELLRAEGRTGDVHALLTAMLTPHVESLADPDNYFLGFLARLLTDQATLSVISRESVAEHMAGYDQLMEYMHARMPRINAEDFYRRLTSVFNWAIHTLAEYDAVEGGDEVKMPVEEMSEELVTMLAAALAAEPPRKPRPVRSTPTATARVANRAPVASRRTR
jgi:AcrR family transcriptional regulator